MFRISQAVALDQAPRAISLESTKKKFVDTIIAKCYKAPVDTRYRVLATREPLDLEES
jgi:hypothetical protein